MDRARYRSIVSDADAAIAAGKALAVALTGSPTSEQHLMFAPPIFGKLVCHAISLRKLAPDPDPSNVEELWDLSSCCSVARSLVETFDALAYIVLNSASAAEREFRLALWDLHDQERRKKVLALMGSSGPQVLEIHASVDRLRSKVLTHPYISSAPPGTKAKILAEDAPAYHLSQKVRNEQSGVNHDYYNAATIFLSQYVHTFPMAVRQLASFQAGDSESLRLMSIPLQYALAFLAKAISDTRAAFPAIGSEDPVRTTEVLYVWSGIATKGVKSAG